MKHTTKRILAFLLCFELLLSMACSTIPVVHATEDTCDCPMTDGLHAATCPNYTCPDCGAAEWHETCPVTGDEPAEDDGEAEAPGAEESTVCETCGNDPCSCESEEEADEEETAACESCGAEEGAIHAASCPNYTCPDCGAAEWHETCPSTDEEETEEEPAIDYSGDIGKYAQIIESEYAFFVCDGSSISENDSIYFYFDEFEEGTILRITNWHWDPDTTALWYQVEFYSGGVLEESTEYWPADPWILQDYTDETYEYDASLVFVPTCGVCGKPDCTVEHVWCDTCGKYDCGLTHTTCGVCGKPDCTTEHVWCDTCGKYDCGLTHTTCGVCGKENCTTKHTFCGVCGGLDCTAEHVYCSICKDFDCGIEHETEPEEEIDNKPITTPVIPETPSLPDEYDVAIVTDSGALVTEAGGFRLSAGYKASLSAWSALGEDVSYQWQICCDAENDLWADITGQTGKGLLFSHAMFAGAQDDAGRAYVRCVTSAGNEELTSEPVCITIDYTDYEAASASAEVAAAAFSLRTDSASLVAYADGDDDDDIEYVTITINYLDAASFITGREKTPVTSPYIASIPKGTAGDDTIAFDQTIVTPNITGYAPFWDKDGDGKIWTGEDFYDTDGNYTVPTPLPSGLDESATEIQLTLTKNEVQTNLVYDVYYLPIKVNIGVRYYFQNLNDDYYTEDVSRYHPDMMRTGTEVTEAYLIAHAGDTTGYTRMYHQPATVAADGSTVFECYYDRNYYLINFSLDGGYGVEPIYARYETPLLVATPTKAGYNFLYWDLLTTDTNGDGTYDAGDGVQDVLPGTVPAENRIYKAKWLAEEGATSYTVAYWINDGDTNTFIGSRVVRATASTAENPVKVSGSNDLSSNINVCGLLDHSHSDSCRKLSCTQNHATHTDACYVYSCGKLAHSHDSSCKFGGKLSQMIYVDSLTDKDKEVAGDGSTVVNVYYTYQKYTLRFYYARTSNSNGLEVVGGTSWPFGRSGSASASSSVDTLLSYVTQWGKVSGLTGERSDFNDAGKARVDNQTYTLGQRTANGYTYYYLQFTAAYGDSLEDLWPVDIFAPVTLRETHDAHPNGISCAVGDPAYFSAWNGEYKVNYSGTHSGNPTIKGLYMYLDDELIYENTYSNRYATYTDAAGNESRLVNYLGFWDNGFNIGWSYPELYHYHLWVEPLPGASGTTYGALTGDTDSPYANYVLYKDFNVYDDSDPGNQTATTLNGYTYTGPDKRTWQKITTGLPTGITEGYRVNFFYTRNSNYSFTVNNQGAAIGAANNVAFETPLATLLDSMKDDGGNPLFTDAAYTPPYPSSLEAGGYYFDGWYTSAACVPGTEVDLEHDIMPAGNLAIYAKWSPVQHTVRFFYHHEYLEAFEAGESTILHDTNGDGNPETIDFVTDEYGMKTVEVLHGHTVEEEKVPVLTQHQLDPDNDKMNFVNWFYVENNQKKAYSPTEIPVKRDLNVYAEWRDGTAQPYQLNFVKKGTDIPIAEPTLGYSDRGVLRTFNAKAGYPNKELYNLTYWTDEKVRELYGLAPEADLSDYKKNYNVGFFPLTSSHSFIVQEELPENWYSPKINVYNFEYVEAKNIQYTVRHVYKATGQLISQEVKYTDYAVVTERFMEIDGYVADAFFKELVIAVEDDGHGNYVGAASNVITFYYTASGDALYAVHHMVEKIHSDDVYADADQLAAIRADYAIDGSGGYEEYGAPIQQVAPIEATINITPIEIPGYALVTTDGVAKYTVGGMSPTIVKINNNGTYTITVKKAGTELYLFYKRLDYQYTVHHYKFNTTELVDPTNLPSVTATAPYHSTVTESAPLYTKDKGYTLVSAAEQSLQIRQENDQNIIIFYYSPIQYQLDYYMVPPEGGSLTLSKEVDSGTEPFTGSTATANPNYKFIGWYTDEACTNEVEPGVTADTYTKSDASGSLIPTRLMDNAGNPITKYAFYAKFELQAADFTITRTNAKEGDIFVYRVVGNGLSIDVTVIAGEDGKGSVTIKDLPLGEYTVTQLNGWSWRYGDTNQAQTADHTVANDGPTFSNGSTVAKWLNGISNFLKNIFGTPA